MPKYLYIILAIISFVLMFNLSMTSAAMRQDGNEKWATGFYWAAVGAFAAGMWLLYRAAKVN